MVPYNESVRRKGGHVDLDPVLYIICYTPDKVGKTKNDHKKIANDLDLQDRIFRTTERQAFISIKDHKPNFQNNPTCRLLNPTKPEIGKISKQILDTINSAMRSKSKLNQWKNTDAVIKWFESLGKKTS